MRSRTGILFLLIIFIIFVVWVGYELHISKYGLEVSSYTIASSELSEGFRVVQLTDLHDSVFGDDNDKLVNLVAGAEPDVILLTGDLVNDKAGEDTSIAVSLISQLKEIAPVYFSYGNQEDTMEKAGVNIRQIYTDAGAVFWTGSMWIPGLTGSRFASEESTAIVSPMPMRRKQAGRMRPCFCMRFRIRSCIRSLCAICLSAGLSRAAFWSTGLTVFLPGMPTAARSGCRLSADCGHLTRAGFRAGNAAYMRRMRRAGRFITERCLNGQVI